MLGVRVYNREVPQIMNEKELKDLLDKYLTGSLSGQDEARLEAWLAEKQRTGDPLFGQEDELFEIEQEALFQRIAHALGIDPIDSRAHGRVHGKAHSSIRNAANSIEQSIVHDAENSTMSMPMPKRSNKDKYKLKIRRWTLAASVVLLIGLGIVGYKMRYMQGATDHPDGQMTALGLQQGGDSATWKTLLNTGSAVKKLVMADGSKVSLYPGSELRYDTALFNIRDRKLYLSGKGFFDVAHDATKPYTVYSRGIATMALGTAFTIDGYINQSQMKIDLIRGKVRIRMQHRPGLKADSSASQHAGFKDVILQAGQYFAYDFTRGKTSSGPLRAPKATSHRKAPSAQRHPEPERVVASPLTYDRASLSKVLTDMETLYQVHIDFKKADMNSIQFSGTITDEEAVQQILKKIGLLNDLKVTEVDKDRFIIDRMDNMGK